MNDDDYEVICNICDLRNFRAICVRDYEQALTQGKNEREAFTIAVATANQLNKDNI